MFPRSRRRVFRPPPPPPNPQEQDQTPSSPPPTHHYPTTVEQVHTTIHHLRRAFHKPLPDEILKTILFHADYDCLHFTASSQTPAVRYASSEGDKISPPKPYISTPPLHSLSGAASIRKISARVTGRDQGHADNPHLGAWSWFEIATLAGDGHLREAFAFARNAVAGREWQVHEFCFDADSSGGVEGWERLWAGRLSEGDRVAVVPMARFVGWQCRVKEAELDVEVEVWR